jgi:hypothetical protein
LAEKERAIGAGVSRLTDCDGENAEADACLDFVRDCGCISTEAHTEITLLNHEVGKMLGSMISNPEKFLLISDT